MKAPEDWRTPKAALPSQVLEFAEHPGLRQSSGAFAPEEFCRAPEIQGFGRKVKFFAGNMGTRS